MPFIFSVCDCSPLVIDKEFDISDEDKLSEYVGKLVLGHYYHIKKIIRTLASTSPSSDDEDIDRAILALNKAGTTSTEIEKRDGWLFQMISWLGLNIENKNNKFYSQQPHDAPAQHGIDGLAILLNDELKIKNIIITEDKCTVNHRVTVPKVWKEFLEFENGLHNNKLVSRLSAMLENVDSGNVLEAIQNDLYSKDLRIYRLAINRNDTYAAPVKRKKLFKGYDDCVAGLTPYRRYAATMHKDDIRQWMEQFSQKVITYLKSQKTTNV